MNRRSFLETLIAVLVIPINKIRNHDPYPSVKSIYDRDDYLYSRIEKSPVTLISSRDMRIPLQIRPGIPYTQIDRSTDSWLGIDRVK